MTDRDPQRDEPTDNPFVDWFLDEVADVDDWLDGGVGERYDLAPLAQDWARVAKMAEETGEAIAELILFTGQNPRKPIDHTGLDRMLDEMADVALTAILGIQHFTKDAPTTASIVGRRLTRIWNRMSAV